MIKGVILLPTKPVIKLRPKTKRVEVPTSDQEITSALTDKLANLSKGSKVSAVLRQYDLEQLGDLTEKAFYRAKKKQISIRMDTDLLAWFQARTRHAQGRYGFVGNPFRPDFDHATQSRSDPCRRSKRPRGGVRKMRLFCVVEIFDGNCARITG